MFNQEFSNIEKFHFSNLINKKLRRVKNQGQLAKVRLSGEFEEQATSLQPCLPAFVSIKCIRGSDCF